MTDSKISNELAIAKTLVYSAQSTVQTLLALQLIAEKVAPGDTEIKTIIESLRETLEKQMSLLEKVGA